MAVPLEIYQEIASFLAKSDIDNLRLAVGRGVFLPDRLWRATTTKNLREERYMRHVKRIKTHLKNIKFPLLEHLEGENITVPCIQYYYQTLRVLHVPNAALDNVALPCLEDLLVYCATERCLMKCGLLKKLVVIGHDYHNYTVELPKLEVLEAPDVSEKWINRQKSLRVLLTSSRINPNLIGLEVLRVCHIDVLISFKNLRALALMNNYPTDFDLPHLEVLLIHATTSECVNRHKKLRILRVDCLIDFDLPCLEVLVCNYTTGACLDRHKTLRRVGLYRMQTIDDFWLPNIEILESACVSRQCIERHVTLRGLNLRYNTEITDVVLPNLEMLSISNPTQECIDRYKGIEWFHCPSRGFRVGEMIPKKYVINIGWNPIFFDGVG